MTFTPRDSAPGPGRPQVNTTRARQGAWGRPVLWVLLIGTLLAALGMLGAWVWRAQLEGPPGTGMERVAPDVATRAPTPPPPTPSVSGGAPR